MWNRRLLKTNGKIAFRRNFFLCVLVNLIASVLGAGVTVWGVGPSVNTGTETTVKFSSYEEMKDYVEEIVSAIPEPLQVIILSSVLLGILLGIVAVILVANVVVIGRVRFYLENREHKTDVLKVFYGFGGGRYASSVVTMFLLTIYIKLWKLLFIIPGVIKSYSYMLVPYLFAENSDLDRKRLFKLSQKMMKGHKWEAFKLKWSFIGWHLASSISGGLLGVFYVGPYISATYAEFYSAVKAEAMMKGIVTQEELPGFYEVEII